MQRLTATLASLILLLAITVPVAFAQDDSQRIYEVTTKDGTRYYGYLQVDTPERVVLRTPGGATVEVARADVASIRVAEGTVVGQNFRPADPNPTRLFFGPTGRALKKGEGYVGVYELFMPFVEVGLTDRLTIGGGTPLFVGGGEHPVWLTPKLLVHQSQRTSTSLGVLHFINLGDGTFGIAYGATTIGSRDSALTLGVGWAYARYGEDHDGAFVLMAGGERRLSRRVKLLTENYFLGGDALLSGGFRLMGERLSVDVGLLIPVLIDEGFIALPIVNFVWRFND